MRITLGPTVGTERSRSRSWTKPSENKKRQGFPGKSGKPWRQADQAVDPRGHGRCWTRTSDPYDVSVVLYQLS
jgi:hypothetical protein